MSKLKDKISNKWRRSSIRSRRNFSIFVYAAILGIIITTISLGYRSPVETHVYKTDADKKATEFVANSTVGPNSYLDEVSEAGFNTRIADVANLSIANATREKHSTLAAKRAMAQSDETSITKPSITIGDSSALTTYTVVDGDSVATIAIKFGISEQTIKWANNLTDNVVAVGKVLTIPSVDGVVYTVKDGDTLASVAQKYSSDSQRIVALNGLGESGLVAGETIVLPDGVLPENERPGYVAPVSINTGVWSPWPDSQATVYAGNRYYWGQCVWYAYNRRAELGRPVGSFWGNANTWDYYARLAGHVVNQTPAPGAVFQTKGGWYGHVGVVERVNPDGSVFVSEMNYVGVGVRSTRTIPNPLYDSYAGPIVYIH